MDTNHNNGHGKHGHGSDNLALVPTSSPTIAALGSQSFEVVDAEIRARWQQFNRGMDEAADGMVHLAIALAWMHEGQLYRQAGYRTLDEYLDKGPGIGKTLAYQLIRELSAFGPERMADLRIQASARRRYLLTQIHALDAEAFDTLLALPPIDGHMAVAMIPEGELTRKIAELEVALDEAYNRYEVLADKLKSEQQLGSNAQRRFEQIQEMNQDLVLARDKAARDVERVKDELEQAKQRGAKTRRELEARIKELERQNTAANEALRRVQQPTAPAIVEQVVVGNDPAMLANLMRLCAGGLQRAHAIEQDAQAVDELAIAISALIEHGGLPFVLRALQACMVVLRSVDLASIAEADAAALMSTIRAFGPVLADIYERGASRG